MISVRCPACEKVMGFEEVDAGSLIACPICREVFFIPAMAQPVPPGAAPAPPANETKNPPVASRLPLGPTMPDPDDIRILADPDLDPILEQCDEVLPADEEPLPPELSLEPDPIPQPEPEPIPQLELDPPQAEEIETVEPIGMSGQVEPTDMAPSLSAAAELSQSLPEKKAPDRPTDVLEEVKEDEDDRFENKDVEEDEEEERPKRRKSKREEPEYRTPYRAQAPRPEGVTRNRIMGGVGTGMGGMILLGTLAHHMTASQNAWHWGICCGDLFALAMVGVGLYFLIKG
jgi:hypothetical protein